MEPLFRLIHIHHSQKVCEQAAIKVDKKLDLFHQGIQESGAVLTNFEDALGPTNRNFEFAQLACNFTQDQWNSGNYSLLRHLRIRDSGAVMRWM